jgi:signal transduction histidine kinase
LFKRLLRRETVQSFPTEFCAADGEIRSVVVDADVLWDKGRFIHSRWFVRDISRRRQLERELLEVSDRERRGFAQELHDGLGQQLGGISYLCNVLRGQLAQRNVPEAPAAARIFSLVRKTIEDTRRLARGLSPIREEPDGLVGALRELALQTSEVLGIRCHVHSVGSELVPDGVLASNLYRIAQEAVNNAVKHGRPDAIRISLLRGQNRLTLTVADNGKGIGNLSPRRKGLGLRIMQYRAGLIGGALTVDPRRPRGTVVVCAVPLPLECSKKRSEA